VRTGENPIRQVVDNVLMRSHVILIFVLGRLVLLLPSVMRGLFSRPGLSRPSEEPVLEIVEGADAGHIFRVKATDEGIKRFVPHLLDPLIKTSLTTQHHGQAGTQHTEWTAGPPALVG
jgi:hypothetical protein